MESFQQHEPDDIIGVTTPPQRHRSRPRAFILTFRCARLHLCEALLRLQSAAVQIKRWLWFCASLKWEAQETKRKPE